MLNLIVWLCVISVLGTSKSCNVEIDNDLVVYCGDGPDSNNIYYDKCAPEVTCTENAIYRTANGTCNNLMNPLWGSSVTPYIRLCDADYNDGDHEVRKQVDGSLLPRPRKVQLLLFFEPRDLPDSNNFHLSQYGQWITHDISLLPPDFSGPPICCDIPFKEINNSSPYQCQLVIEVPLNDPVHGGNQRCMEFRRAMTAANNFNCSITPQIPMNQATSFIDSSQLYGHQSDKADSIRTFNGGKLITDIVDENQFCPLRNREGSLLCDGRANVGYCFEAGDPRINQHFGITSYTIMFTRFHNVVADLLQNINPQWTDEVLYQETRKFIGALNQIITYRDYLPILLGESYTNSVGLNLSNFKRTKYNPLLMPQLSIEFAAGAFRVPHNTVASIYNYMNKNYDVVDTAKLNEWMSIPDPLLKGSNLDDIVRGMTITPGRYYSPSYNYLISNFMFNGQITGNQDLLSVDIQRGRDVGLKSYTKMREWCGLSKINSFDDLLSFLTFDDVETLKGLYATVDDIDLLVGALLEPPVDGGTVGQTAQCLLADVFYRIRYGDRFFVDVSGQPGSFSIDKLRTLRNLDLGHVICATTKLDEVPIDIFQPSIYSQMVKCSDHLLSLDLSAWKEPS
ncbi:peroxidase-like isoform X1 [Rhopalosiphum padi]|uniref:peroxidase-like isoform X1 n=2 Tax=Rhopalosiphum padi TaxID=40932 RepID=UPI00298D64E8|nr:peroxidase-like isoform X1 [Rhopalosiphum padi]XP_060850510.1 peroxidase-like isoform X1 [Rhopalosiphum padi]